MKTWNVAIEMCEKIVDKSPSEERLWGRLHEERKEWNNQLIDAAKRNQVDTVQQLLDAKADVDSKNENGQTALHWAAKLGHKDVVALLLDKGADVAATGKDGWTALHRAAWEGHKDVVALLLDKGADVAATTKDGWTALHWAAQLGHKDVAALLERAVEKESRNTGGAKDEHQL
jgi:ankyrin repeat protein